MGLLTVFREAPPPFVLVTGILFAVFIILGVVLFHLGAYTYARVTPYGVTYRLLLGSIPLNLTFTVDLNYGDAIVVTEEGLFIWRCSGRGYERVRLDAKSANPGDWAKLRAWAASIWPHHPASSHLNGSAAPRAQASLSLFGRGGGIWGP